MDRPGKVGLGLVVLAAAIALDVAPACEPDRPRGPIARAPDPIVIGVSLGLTGDLGSFTLPLQNAVRVAEAQVNAVGGLFGRPVEFRIVDDKSDEDKVVFGVVSQFVSDGALAVIGPAGSSQVVAVQDLLRKNKIIQITPSATSPALTTIQTPSDRFLFRTTPNDDVQGKVLVIVATAGASGSPSDAGAGDGGGDAGASAGGCKRMAIVHIDNAYGNGMAQVISATMPSRGGQIVLDIAVPVQAAAQYKNEIAQVMNARPDCMALIAYDVVGDQVMRDLQTARTQTPGQLPPGFFVIGTDGIYTSGFIMNGRRDPSDPTSPTVAEGVIGTNPDTNPKTREYYEFKNLYAAHYPLPKCDPADPGSSEPAPFTANIFDASIMAVLAIAKAGTKDRARIRDSLLDISRTGRTFSPAQIGDAIQAIQAGQDIDYKGASGNVDLDDNGDTLGDFIVWKVVDGKYRTIGRVNSETLAVDFKEPPPCQ
jgi:ABC-type branched-subunit amino acid transport system substrate-binding protein